MATSTTSYNSINVICLEEKAFYALVDTVVERIQDKMQVKEERWITADQAMQKLHIGKSTLQKLRDTGAIRFSQMEKKHILYDASSIDEYILQNTKNTF